MSICVTSVEEMSFIGAQGLAAAGLGSICLLSALPHTLLLSRYRGILASYKDGEEETMSASMYRVIDKVLYAMNISEEDELNIKFFPCFSLDPVSKGSTKLRTGAIIGLPKTFSVSSYDDLDIGGLKLGRQSVDWESPAGQELHQSLMLSDKAKAFVTAREMSYAGTYHVHVDLVLKTLMGCLAYTTGYLLNNSFGMKRRLKVFPRVVMYSLIAGFYGLFYLSLDDTYNCYLDNSVDKKVGNLSQELAEGGSEFYSKMLLRNQAIRSLLGSHGDSLYTPFGNEVTSVRQPHTKLTTRRDNLVKILNNTTVEEDSDVKGYFS